LRRVIRLDGRREVQLARTGIEAIRAAIVVYDEFSDEAYVAIKLEVLALDLIESAIRNGALKHVGRPG
jgi:hypothetical protein